MQLSGSAKMRVTTQQTYVSMTQSFNNLSGDLAHVVE
ncbi:flagellar hook-associated protein 3, partial [Escherichia coli]|nr:flagellar hook-associated protein 3 [Escherichia coli]